MSLSQGWSRWYDDAPEHPKFIAAGHRAGWLYVCGQAYSSRLATDGKIPKAVVPRLTDIPQPMKHAARLVDAGLWHDRGDHFEQHDYAAMQRTRDEREAAAQGRSEGGAHGNHLRWHVARKAVAPDCRWCTESPNRSATRSQDRSPTDTESVSTETETEAETEREAPPPPTGPTRVPDAWQPTRAHAEFATAHRLDLSREADKFRNHAKAKGRLAADWHAAFSTWLQRGADYTAANGTGPAAQPSDFEPSCVRTEICTPDQHKHTWPCALTPAEVR